MAPIAITKYQEAQLIIAESRVLANDLTGAETAINRSRSQTAGLPAYSALQLEPLAQEHTAELARRLFETAGAEAQRIAELAETAEYLLGIQ